MTNVVVAPFAHRLDGSTGREAVVERIHNLAADIPLAIEKHVQKAADVLGNNPYSEAAPLFSEQDMRHAVWLGCLFDAALNRGLLPVEEWADEVMMRFASACYHAAGFNPDEENPMLSMAVNSLAVVKN